MRKKRAAMSEEEKEEDRRKNAESKRQKKGQMSEEEKEEKRRKDAERKRFERGQKSAEEKAKQKSKDVQRKAKTKSHIKPKDGLRSQEVLQGILHVSKLEDSMDSIGEMTWKCEYCGALKFKKETPSSCCSNGKVLLEPFPTPPSKIQALWTGNDERAALFRKHARTINNAVCLTSLEAMERRGGFTPSIIFQGKVHHRVGALLPDQGNSPKFAQLYVFDSAMESSTRFKNMILPTTLNLNQKNTMRELLQTVQDDLHEKNPFIKDFLQIVDIPEADLENGKIVISAKKPSREEHDRRYNLQTNLQEVSILTNEQPNDLVLQRRGGGLQYVSDLNPKGMPLHFTLLFPHGTYGWDPETKQTNDKRRITTREFYVFHLNVRECLNQNYLHRSQRLFQEWICMAWVWVENQRLNYHRQNQKALRAESYKNLREAVQDRQREVDQVYRDDHQPSIGRKILSSSFSGGPRWYNAKFQDGMAICREYHKPA